MLNTSHIRTIQLNIFIGSNNDIIVIKIEMHKYN